MSGMVRPKPSALAHHWTLDPEVVFLNHGSFGATPASVLALQSSLRQRLEREPVRFMVRELEPLLDAAREELAAFVGSDPEDLVFVPNATTGVNAVLRSLDLRAGDELLTTDHAYNACKNALEFVAGHVSARVVVAAVPFPIASEDAAVEAVLRCVTPRTRLFLLDHVTSPTALVLPAERLVRELNARGVQTLIDGAHAPGMIDLDLRTLGAAWYTANCHKWMCAPKGCAFLWVRRDLQPQVRPTVISHGANSPRADRSRYQLEFDWTGTADPTPFLCVGEALRFVGSLLPGGWPEVRAHNRALALEGRRVLCEALGVQAPAPESMIGSLASVAIPDGEGGPLRSPLYLDPLQDELFEKFGIEVPIVPFPAPPKRLVRISAHLHNTRDQYVYLARALAP
jgi:isopenicillin-N epimerase